MIVTLLGYCSKCDHFFKERGDCPNCGGPLETKAVINAYELRELIKKLATPEGIAKTLGALQKWLES